MMKTDNTKSHSLANFVGCVVGFLNVCIIRLVAYSLPPRYPLNATWYKEWVSGKLAVRPTAYAVGRTEPRQEVAVQPLAAAEQRLEQTGLRPAVQPRLR
jgi:hypothetical protein